jgi:hypothetical protein
MFLGAVCLGLSISRTLFVTVKAEHDSAQSTDKAGRRQPIIVWNCTGILPENAQRLVASWTLFFVGFLLAQKKLLFGI